MILPVVAEEEAKVPGKIRSQHMSGVQTRSEPGPCDPGGGQWFAGISDPSLGPQQPWFTDDRTADPVTRQMSPQGHSATGAAGGGGGRGGGGGGGGGDASQSTGALTQSP